MALRPPCRTLTRLPACPRITGCPTPGPKLELVTPGWFLSVSPMVAAASLCSTSPASTLVAWLIPADFSSSGEAEITISSIMDLPCCWFGAGVPSAYACSPVIMHGKLDTASIAL